MKSGIKKLSECELRILQNTNVEDGRLEGE